MIIHIMKYVTLLKNYVLNFCKVLKMGLDLIEFRMECHHQTLLTRPHYLYQI